MDKEFVPIQSQRELSSVEAWLMWLVKGTEDFHPNSPAWATITDKSASVVYMTRFLPAQEWLRLPASMYEAISKYVRERAYIIGAAKISKVVIRRGDLAHVRRIMSLAWQFRHLDVDLVTTHLGVDVEDAQRYLDYHVAEQELIRCELGQKIWYELPGGPGLLFYGPQRGSLDPTIESWTEAIMEHVTTPFPMEFACADWDHEGAPILARMEPGQGTCVPATVYILQPDWNLDSADAEYLLHPPQLVAWNERRATGDISSVVPIHTLPHFHPMARITYCYAPSPNMTFVTDPTLSTQEKGRRLADLAVASLTARSFDRGMDGIRYLMDAIAQGVETPLTAAYRDALLILADDAPDLATARQRLAVRRGLGDLPA